MFYVKFAERPVEDDEDGSYITGEGRNIEEAFASFQAQIKLSKSCETWVLKSVKYQLSDYESLY